MGQYFGTDGIRGRAGVHPMSPDFVMRLGQAIGLHFRVENRPRTILIGKDTRRSGYMLETALTSGLCSVGMNVGLVGPLPTPGIAYLTRGMRACAGIVISASHNPYEDNGIKIFTADGYKLPDEVECELERLVQSPELEERIATGEEIGRTRRVDDSIGQYAVFLKEQFPKHLTLEGLRIVLDCANGASYKVAPKVFRELGAECFPIGVEPDGLNINEQCGALYPQALRERVMLYKADIGIALDGDADRLIVVDSRGEIVDGDEIMAICGRHMMKNNSLKHGAVVTTVMSNMGLEVSLRQVGAKVIRTKVGDRYVVEEMKSGGYNLGGEQSGHLIFRDSSTTGDGILAALHLLEIAVSEGKPIHEMKRCMTHFPQIMKNVRVQEKVPLDRLPKFSAMVADVEDKLAGEGRVVFRYSGTERVARVMVEGPREDMVVSMVDELCSLLEREIASKS